MAAAVVLSGGTGTRMEFDGFPKQYVEVAGKAVLMYALEALARAESVDEIVIVAAGEWRGAIAGWMSVGLPNAPFLFADPGSTRQGSIRNGLRALEGNPPADDLVIVHDAARPNLTGALVDAYLSALGAYDALMPVLPMKDTVYVSADGASVTELLDRDALFAGQAPEVFRFARYLEVNERASDAEIEITRGSSEIAFRHGMSIKMVEGTEDNYKITTRADLRRFCEQVGADYEECIAAIGEGREQGERGA